MTMILKEERAGSKTRRRKRTFEVRVHKASSQRILGWWDDRLLGDFQQFAEAAGRDAQLLDDGSLQYMSRTSRAGHAQLIIQAADLAILTNMKNRS